MLHTPSLGQDCIVLYWLHFWKMRIFKGWLESKEFVEPGFEGLKILGLGKD